MVEKAGFFFRDELPPLSPDDLLPKKMTREAAISGLKAAADTLSALPTFSAPDIEAGLRALAEAQQINPGQLFSVIRNAVTGQQVTPPLFETLDIIGRPVSLARIAQAVTILEKMDQKSQ